MGDLPVLVGGLGRSCFLGGLGCLGGPNFVGGALDPCRSPDVIAVFIIVLLSYATSHAFLYQSITFLMKFWVDWRNTAFIEVAGD